MTQEMLTLLRCAEDAKSLKSENDRLKAEAKELIEAVKTLEAENARLRSRNPLKDTFVTRPSKGK